MLEGRVPGPYSLVLSPLCSLCLYPHKGCHCPDQCFWDCLQLGLFPPLRSCELDGRMRLRPPVLSCPVLALSSWQSGQRGLGTEEACFCPTRSCLGPALERTQTWGG